MHFINIPTTLLAMVDASAGGKTGINFEGLKNEIGVFRQADRVIVDTRFLKTLDQQNLLSGYAEMLKHGLISDRQTWAHLLADDILSDNWADMLGPQIAESIQIKQRLVSQNLCKDPTITVTFYDMKFSVLGNAGAGGKEITKDKITLLEAIAMASDLQIDGLRKNVLVMRQEGDQQVPYRVDLTSAESIYNSPVYYIRQNDVIYVEPNDKFKRNSTVMTNDAYRPTFWMSVASFLTTIALIFIK